MANLVRYIRIAYDGFRCHTRAIVFGDFAAHESTDSRTNGWCVTHTPSGRKIPSVFYGDENSPLDVFEACAIAHAMSQAFAGRTVKDFNGTRYVAEAVVAEALATTRTESR